MTDHFATLEELLSAAKLGFDHIDRVSHGNDWLKVQSAIAQAEAAIALMRDDCAMRAAAKFLDYCDAQAAPFTAIATLQALCEEGVKVEIDPKELLDFFSAALQQKESSL